MPAAMHAAAQALIGEHDFSAFRSVECQSQTATRRVDAIEVRRDGDYVWVEISANAYLHHMVRNIVGTLLDVQCESDPAGRHGRSAGERGSTQAPAPRRRPSGLYLWRVEYPARFRYPCPGRTHFGYTQPT